MNAQLTKIKEALAADPKKFVKITPVNTGNPIERPNASNKPKVRKSYIFLDDIQATGKDLYQFIDDIATETNSQVRVEIRLHHGNSSKAVHEVDSILYVKQSSQEQQHPITMNENPQNPHNSAQQPVNSQPNYGMNSGFFGMNFVEIADLKTKAERSNDHYKNFMDEKEKVMKLQNELNEKNAEIIDLKTFKSTADQKLEYAIMKAQFDNKGFMDSEAAKEMIAAVKEIGIGTLAGRAGNPAAVQGMNSAQVSQIKSQLIASISDPQVSDDVIELLTRVANGLNSDAFVEELYKLLDANNL
jgi:hypothetical protein